MMLIDPFRSIRPATLSYEGQSSASVGGGGSATITITSVPIGTAAADRKVFMLIHWLGVGATAALLSSLTIGGVSATIHLQDADTNGLSFWGCAIVSAAVPTGTTAAVVGTVGANISILEAGSFRATGVMFPTARDTFSTVVSAPSSSQSIDVDQDGFVISGGTFRSGAVTHVFTGITRRYEVVINPTFFADGAGDETPATQAGKVITAARSGGSGTDFQGPFIGASFR